MKSATRALGAAAHFPSELSVAAYGNGAEEAYVSQGDFEYIVRAFHNSALRYRHLSEVLVHMQTGGASTDGWRAKILLNREVLRACRENGLQTNLLKILSKYPAKMLELLQK